MAVGAASAVYQTIAEHRGLTRYRPPGQLIDVGGRRVHVVHSGTATPTVVVLPGMGHTTLGWMRVLQDLAEMTDAAVYVIDRVGWSDPAPWPRTPNTIARELEARP
jgi:hypothetical protein